MRRREFITGLGAGALGRLGVALVSRPGVANAQQRPVMGYLSPRSREEIQLLKGWPAAPAFGG